MFVHLAPLARAAAIRRNGLTRVRRGVGNRPGGLFAVPVTPNFVLTHQWVRELKRRGQGPLVGVYFRVGDKELVRVGRYNESHGVMSAAEAVSAFLGDACLGWEVVIPRRVRPKEIHAIRAVPQVVGWRYSPESKGKPPFCGCRFCTRGEFGARKLRERLGTP